MNIKTAISIAKKDLKNRYRERRTRIMTLVMPIALVTIFGLAFQNMESEKIQLDLTVVNKDQSGEITNKLLEVLAGVDQLKITQLGNEVEAENIILKLDTDGLLIIPEGFSEKVTGKTGEIVRLRLKLRQDQSMKSSILRGIVESIVNEFSSRATTPLIAAQIALSMDMSEAEAEELATRAAERVKEMKRSEFPIQLEYDHFELRDGVSAVENYSSFGQSVTGVGMMFILLGCVVAGGSALIQERRTGTLFRLMAAPVSRWTIFGGKVAAVLLMGVIQALIIFGFGALVFRVEFGNPVGVALITGCLILTGTALGIMISSVSRSEQQVEGVAIPLIMVLTALGGGWFPIEIAPSWMQVASTFLPTGSAMNAYHALMWSGRGLVDIAPNLAIMLLYAGTFALIGVNRLRWD